MKKVAQAGQNVDRAKAAYEPDGGREKLTSNIGIEALIFSFALLRVSTWIEKLEDMIRSEKRAENPEKTEGERKTRAAAAEHAKTQGELAHALREAKKDNPELFPTE